MGRSRRLDAGAGDCVLVVAVAVDLRPGLSEDARRILSRCLTALSDQDTTTRALRGQIRLLLATDARKAGEPLLTGAAVFTCPVHGTIGEHETEPPQARTCARCGAVVTDVRD